jgi:hypothetical protein
MGKLSKGLSGTDGDSIGMGITLASMIIRKLTLLSPVLISALTAILGESETSLFLTRMVKRFGFNLTL